MATLKIYQVQNQVKTGNTPQLGQLQIPLGLATAQGKAISSFGKAVENIYFENKAEEDAMEASDIIGRVNQDLTAAYSKYNTSTSIKDVLKFGEDVDNIEFESSNKAVKKLVQKHLRKNKNSMGLSLGKEISKRSTEKLSLMKDEQLNNFITDMTSNDEVKRITGTKLYNQFWTDPLNGKFYGETALKKKKEDTDQLVLKNIYIKGVSNGDIDLTDNETRKKILAQFTDLNGQKFLEKARSITISQVLADEEANRKSEKATVVEQLHNFTKLIDNINANKSDETKRKPTLDEIYDLYQIGSLNTAQYNALVKHYADPNKLSDLELLENINVQIAAASTVSDLDNIEAALNNDKNLLENIDPTQVAEFSKIIDKYKGDIIGITDYKKYNELLKSHVKDVANVLSFVSQGGDGDAKVKSINAQSEYNRLINNGLSPEDAYLEVISTFTEKDLPKPELLPMPIGFELTDVKESLNKNPDSAFDTLYKKAVDKFAQDGNEVEYKENIKRLDLIQDVFKVRKEIFGDEDYLGKFKIKKSKKKAPEKSFIEKGAEFFKNLTD